MGRICGKAQSSMCETEKKLGSPGRGQRASRRWGQLSLLASVKFSICHPLLLWNRILLQSSKQIKHLLFLSYFTGYKTVVQPTSPTVYRTIPSAGEDLSGYWIQKRLRMPHATSFTHLYLNKSSKFASLVVRLFVTIFKRIRGFIAALGTSQKRTAFSSLKNGKHPRLWLLFILFYSFKPRTHKSADELFSTEM